ncbi:MAG: hypothetical protein KKD44_27480, partial [Proteobacteria bacterium]|nr:hypothetical protein [Pseudomonadota bacterium]
EWTEDLPSDNKSVVFRKKHVERDNNGQYDIAIIAMAPAREEVREGRVLVGPSGQTLRQTFEQLGIEEFYACNVLLCPILSEDTDTIQQAVSCCRDVVEEVRARQPRLTIVLGDLPLRKFTNNLDYTISELQGRVLPGITGAVLPLLHPAFYLRRPQEFYDFIECARSGIKYLSGTYVQAGTPTMEVVNLENLNEVRNKINNYPDLAFDLETNSLYAYGWEPGRILEMGLAVEPNHAYVIPSELIGEFKDLLEKKNGVTWNGPFDASFLKQRGISPNIEFDGMVAHYTIDERGYGHRLKKVAKIYLGCDDWDKALRVYFPRRSDGEKEVIDYSIIPTEVRYPYLAKDVTRTLQLKEVLLPDINHKVFYSLLMPAVRMFIEIRHRGQRVNPVKLMQMEEILSEDISKLEQELYELTGEWINANSPNQVRALVYDKMGLPVDPFFTTDTGAASTSRGALESYMQDPIIANIFDQKDLTHTRGHYIDQFARFMDQNYRIHPNINVTRAVTGRLSSDDPNIMNIKRDSRLKEVFLADNIMGYGDIKGNELGWYGIIARDETLLKILREGGDPHNVVSIAAYGEELAAEMRTAAKAVVFGRMYRRGRRSIEYQVGPKVIDRLMETVDAVFPRVKEYYKETMEELKKGYLESFFGRKRRFPLITQQIRHHVENQAVNFKPQSCGSDLMLYCLLYLWENKERLGVWPFWPVHDSITWDMEDKETLPVIKKELEEYSLELVNNMCPFIWEVDWGYNWAMQKELPEINPNRKYITVS